MMKWLTGFCLLFVVGLLVYSNSFNNKFLMDDYTFLDNPLTNSTKNIWSQWNPYQRQVLGVNDTHEILGYYRPLAHMLLGFSYSTFGNHFFYYHFLNLFLLVLASSMIFLLIEQVTSNSSLSFCAAIFYLIHPMNGIIINYISASVFACQIIFTLATILLLWSALERKNSQFLYFLSLFSSFLSLFWNESGVMIPFYVAIFILLFGKQSLPQKMLLLFPYFLIVFSYLVFRCFFISLNGTVFNQISAFHLNVWEYLANLFLVYAWYVCHLFYPWGIVMSWTTPIVKDHVFWYASGMLLFIVLALLLFIRYAKEKICQWGLLWFFIGFIPVSIAAFRRPDSGGALIEPHWFIISFIGFSLLVSCFCLFIFTQKREFGFCLIAVLILGWGLAAHANNKLWANQKTYALYWSKEDPSLKSAYFYLAQAYQGEGDFDQSIKYYRLALAGYPSDVEIYNNLGVIDQNKGDWKEAELDYRKVLKIDPSLAVGYNNLASIYFHEDKLDQAQENFNRSLTLDPLLVGVRRNLAFLFLKQKKYDKAIDLCFKNLEISNNDVETLMLLVNIYIQKHDFVNLQKYAFHILNFVNDPTVLVKLGEMMGQNNLPEIGSLCFEKTIRLDPRFDDAYIDMGVLLANLGKYKEAMHIWQIGWRLDPSNQNFENDIAQVSKRIYKVN